MPRPLSDNPSPAALRKRKQRAKVTGREGEAEGAPEAAPPAATSRLVLCPLWIPKGDEKAARLFAERLRKAARIPDSEVPG